MKQLQGSSDRAKALFTETWAWREQLQRAMDGCHTTDDMSVLSLAQYEEFEGPNIPLPSGYQVMLTAICHLVERIVKNTNMERNNNARCAGKYGLVGMQACADQYCCKLWPRMSDLCLYQTPLQGVQHTWLAFVCSLITTFHPV